MNYQGTILEKKIVLSAVRSQQARRTRKLKPQEHSVPPLTLSQVVVSTLNIVIIDPPYGDDP